MDMNGKRVFIAAFSALAFGLGAMALAGAKSITLPTDPVQLKASPLPGYA